MRLFWFTLTLMSFFLGCRPPAGAEVYLAPGVPFRLCAPQAAATLFITQEVVFRLPGGTEEIAQAVLENRDGTFSMVASTPMGQTLFVVQVKGSAVTVDSRIPIPGDLDPRVLPALVQFSIWPADAVRRGLSPEVQFLEEGPKRSLIRKGKTVWTVTRTGEEWPPRTLLLDNPGLHLSARIRTLDE